MELKDALQFTAIAEEFRPAVKKAFEVLESYGPELSGLFTLISKGIVKRKIEMIKMFEEAGFEREDAIFLVQDEWYALQRNLRSTGGKKSNK